MCRAKNDLISILLFRDYHSLCNRQTQTQTDTHAAIYIRGVQKQLNFKIELAQNLIPFLWGILSSTKNFNFLGGWEVLPLDSEKSGNRIFHFLALNTILYDI